MFLVQFQLYVNVSAGLTQKGTFTCLKLSCNCEPVHMITRTIVSSWYRVYVFEPCYISLYSYHYHVYLRGQRFSHQ